MFFFQIEDLQDQMEDMLDMNNEIQEAMSRQFDTPDVGVIYLFTNYLGGTNGRLLSRKAAPRHFIAKLRNG